MMKTYSRRVIYCVVVLFLCSCVVKKSDQRIIYPVYYTFYDDTAFCNLLSAEIIRLIDQDHNPDHPSVNKSVKATDYFLVLNEYVHTYGEKKVFLELCYCDGKVCVEGTKELVSSSNRYFKLNSQINMPIIFSSDLLYSDKALIDNLRQSTVGGGYLIELNYTTKKITSAWQD